MTVIKKGTELRADMATLISDHNTF